ncbi:hypothetical protein AB6802_20530 [Mesorhizobium sp. RCC_202]|uniref:hypothetical protein n=1 Tax=Mesorhizobium sp. RCC_202 TaxID=3239222 RepID=UPI0035250C0B
MLVVVCLLFPRFGQTYENARGWADQKLYLTLLAAADQGQAAWAADQNYMGPGYLAAVQALKSAFALHSVSALILLNRVCAAVAIALPAFVYGVRAPFDISRFAVSIAIFVIFVTSTMYLYQSGVPWSHFVAALPAVAFVLLLSSERKTPLSLGAAGGALGILASIRAFEALALGSLLMTYAVVWALINFRSVSKIHLLGSAAVFLVCAAVGYSLHGVILGHVHLYDQYAGGMDPESFKGSLLRIQDFPVKFMQFFIDPCFYSICSEVDYTAGTPFIFQTDPTLSNWAKPFALQIPFFVGATIVGFLLLVARPRLVRAVFADPVLFVSIGGAFGIAFAYMCFIVGGGDQLKYGFARELFTPSLLLMIAILQIVTTDYLPVGMRRAAVPVLAFIAIVGLQIIPSIYGFVRLNSTYIAKATGEQDCSSGSCHLKLHYFDSAGKELDIPLDDPVMVRVTCGEVTTFSGVVDPDEFSYDPKACPKGAVVTALSTTTGISRRTRDLGIGAVISQGAN